MNGYCLPPSALLLLSSPLPAPPPGRGQLHVSYRTICLSEWLPTSTAALAPVPSPPQAVKLLIKGVPFYAPPGKHYQQLLVAETSPTAAAAAAGAATAGAASGAAATGEKGKVAGGNGAAAGAKGGGSSSNSSSNGAAQSAAAVVSACGGAPGGLCPVAAWSRGAGGHSHPRNAADGRHFVWRQAPGWPWRDQA